MSHTRLMLATLALLALAHPGAAQMSTDDAGLLGGITSGRERMDEARRAEERARQKRLQEAERERAKDDARQLAAGGFPFKCKVTCSGAFGGSRGEPTTMATYAPDAHSAARLIEPGASKYCRSYSFDHPKALLYDKNSRAGASVSCERQR